MLGSTVLAVDVLKMDHIILDGHHTAECWFHAEFSACQLCRVSSSLTIFLCGSWLIFEILVDSRNFPTASRAALWIEAFFSGDMVVLWTGTVMYLTVQWIRTVADWPYIFLDKYQQACPFILSSNISTDGCSIPDGTRVSAAFILLLSVACLVVWGLHFYWIKASLYRQGNTQPTVSNGTDVSQSPTAEDAPLQPDRPTRFLQPTPGIHHHVHSFLHHIFQPPAYELHLMAQPQVAGSTEGQQMGSSRCEETDF